jgi:hypothetical protein
MANPISGVLKGRRLINTAEFDPVSRTVVARGRAQPLAAEDGYEALRGYEDGLYDAVWNGRTAAYPAGERGLRRHEIFHGLVDKATQDPELNVSPTVNALAAARRMVGDRGPLAGARDITEEIIAHVVGGQTPKSLAAIGGISPTLNTYAKIYHQQRGLGSALPVYAMSYATHPSTLSAGAVGGGLLAYGLSRPDSEPAPRSLDALIERLGKQ